MKTPLRNGLLRRAGTTTPDRPDERPAPPRPPRGRPVVEQVAVLDGRRLWLATTPEPGTVALRDAGSGEVVAPVVEAQEDEPRWRSVRIDLEALPWADGTAYDLVLDRPGGRGARPLWCATLAPTRSAPAPDGDHRYELALVEDGVLRLRRRALEPAAVLREVAVLAEGARLVLEAAGAPPDARLCLLTEDGAALAEHAVTADGDLLAATLTADRLPRDVDVRTRVVLRAGSGEDLPVRRRADDLPDPGRGAPLPAYESDEGPVLALRWSAQGLLTARVRPAGPDGEPR